MPFSLLCYFVGVKAIILNHIEMVSKIQILCYFHLWAILSVKHIVKSPFLSERAFYNDIRSFAPAAKLLSMRLKIN